MYGMFNFDAWIFSYTQIKWKNSYKMLVLEIAKSSKQEKNTWTQHGAAAEEWIGPKWPGVREKKK